MAARCASSCRSCRGTRASSGSRGSRPAPWTRSATRSSTASSTFPSSPRRRAGPRRGRSAARRRARMWILVIGDPSDVERPDGAASVLRDLGCRVRVAPICDPWQPEHRDLPPAAVLIEALHDFPAARAALDQLRAEPLLAQAPIVAAVPVGSLQCLDGADGFDDFVLAPYIPAELYVRIRRVEWRRGEFVAPERIKIGPVWIDLASQEVALDG